MLRNKSLTPINKLVSVIIDQKRLLLVFLIIITLSSIFESIGIGSLYPIIDIFENESRIKAYSEFINNHFHTRIGANNFVIFLFIGVFIAIILRCIFITWSYYIQCKMSEKLVSKWQIKIFDQYLNYDYSFYVGHQVGDLIQNQMTHTEIARQGILSSCIVGRESFVIIFLYVTLCMISLKTTLYISIFMIFFTIIFLKISKMKVYFASKVHAILQKRVFSMSAEVFSGIRQVKAFAVEEFFKSKFNAAVTERAKIRMKNATIGYLPAPIMQTLALLGIVIALFIATILINDTKGSLPMITVFGGIMYRVFGSIANLNTNFMNIANSLPSIEIVYDLLSFKDNSINLPCIKAFKENIVFEDVNFSYPGNSFRLTNCDISFEKGKFYGIVGPSGSGKSTIIDLLLGFYKPDKGRILIDNKDLSKFDIRTWRSIIGYISQETFLFNGTVEENISFAMNISKNDKNNIIRAAKNADMFEFVSQTPNKFNTDVGERGLKFSGGQRQRLAIARAVYRDPDIFIFDEATSSLDTYSEKRIQQSIEKLSKVNTVVVISHRLSTVINADEIIVIKNGFIVEKGKHRELLNNKGYYAQLYADQMNSDNEYDKKN